MNNLYLNYHFLTTRKYAIYITILLQVQGDLGGFNILMTSNDNSLGIANKRVAIGASSVFFG